jgi:uncharacterized membrane protein
MGLKLIYALILTILPITELRIGLPFALAYASQENLPFFPIFTLIVLLNIAVIFFIFFFLDHLHKYLMRINTYQKFFNLFLRRIRKRVEKFQKRYNRIGFLALVLFVAIPLPGTGAWTGCLVSWLLGLERKRSIISIALGVIIAGTLIFLGSLGIMSFFV